MKILQVILSYDYLWLNIRVKGGLPYGCMSGFGRSGEGYLVSYRDPNLKETNDIYEGIPAYLEAFDPDERDMTKYVIGTISNLDAPLTPSVKGSRGLSAYLSGVTEEMMQTERDQILGAAKEDIRALGCPGTGSSGYRKLLRSRKRGEDRGKPRHVWRGFQSHKRISIFERINLWQRNRKVRILINCWRN